MIVIMRVETSVLRFPLVIFCFLAQFFQLRGRRRGGGREERREEGREREEEKIIIDKQIPFM